MSSPSEVFRNSHGQNAFYNKYALGKEDTWAALAKGLVKDVCEGILPASECALLERYIAEMKIIPGGRYLYYARRQARFWQNCYIFLAEEDTREEWGRLLHNSSDALMSGGGVGTDYSILRPRGSPLGRTGGVASGPVPLMYSINEVGRNVMQGGSRRSAIYASLNWQHGDVWEFLHAKNWDEIITYPGGPSIADIKAEDFNFPAPLDMTNISVNYDNAYLEAAKDGLPAVFMENVRQALRTGEPGFSFNFGAKEKETGRNACTEVTSADDSDVCNLASVNLSRIETLDELEIVTWLGARLLVCGTIRGELPYPKVRAVREKNRRLGLGLMGMHEWLLRRGYRYEVVPELHAWLAVWRSASEDGANLLCDSLGLNRPVAYRAIAPCGTISMLAGTTSGIEPLFACAYKRRYLAQQAWHYEFVVDPTAHFLIREGDLDPEKIETAYTLSANPEQRVRFQADVQDYVDQGISSTINLPEWGHLLNCADTVEPFARMLAKYAPRLRGFTCYPNGSRGGQPLTEVGYAYALAQGNKVFRETDVCRGGVCGS